MAVKSKTVARARRHARLRKKVIDTEQRPRLVVTRSARHVFVQVVDDSKGHTVAAASTPPAETSGGSDSGGGGSSGGGGGGGGGSGW